MGSIQAANFSDHSCNLAAGRAHRLATPRTSISPPRGTDGAGDFCGAYAHEPNGDGRRALSRHCSRSQTTYYRHVTMANAALRWLSRENPDIDRARDAMSKVVAAGHQASDVITNVYGLLGMALGLDF